MSPEEAFRFLDSLPLWNERNKFGLRLVKKIFSALGNPQDKMKTIHVAGTNGKGSICSMLDSILRVSGKRVGLITSPHLLSPLERCRIDGEIVSEENFSQAIGKIVSISEKLEIRLSYYELVIAAVFFIMKESAVEWCVVEVGLGGRLDGTNIIKCPELGIISNISLDHTQVLGSSHAEIAREKAGIAKSGSTLLVGQVDRESLSAIVDVWKEVGCNVLVRGEDWSWNFSSDSLLFCSQTIPLQLSELSLLGRHQIENAEVAACAAHFLGISRADIEQGLSCVKWSGRCELRIIKLVTREVEFLFDAAHNKAGICALVSFLDELILKRKKRGNSIF